MTLLLGSTWCISKICFKYPFLSILFIVLLIVMFFIIKKTFVRFPSIDEKQDYLNRTKKLKRFVLLTRTIILLLLAVALASPYITKTKVIQGEPSIKILADNSTSF